MRADVREAIESARTTGLGDGKLFRGVEPQRNRSFQQVRAVVLAVIEQLDSDMTLGELTEELMISEAQYASD
jgi:hypothetical protein